LPPRLSSNFNLFTEIPACDDCAGGDFLLTRPHSGAPSAEGSIVGITAA
jgi:hypothetical protein